MLNYDNQYSFGGDILVYYKIQQPEPLSATEAELKDLITDYDPAVEIQKAIDSSSKAATSRTDEKTEALISTVRECKSALQRYDELMKEFEGYQAKQLHHGSRTPRSHQIVKIPG